MKYVRKVISTGIVSFQNNIAYRGNFLMALFAGMVTFITQVLFWPALYGVKLTDRVGQLSGSIAGYRLNDMISYSLMVYILQWGISAASTGYSIKEDVLSGRLSNYILKPFNYLSIKAIFSLTGQIITFIISIFVFLLIVWKMGILLSPRPDVISKLFAIPAVFISFIISFLISSLTGLVSFWILETSSLNVFIKGVVLILSGAVFPLNFIDGFFARLLQLLPFSYMIFFPAQIFLGRVSIGSMVQNYVISLFWILFLSLTVRFFWKRGLNRYSAYGG